MRITVGYLGLCYVSVTSLEGNYLVCLLYLWYASVTSLEGNYLVRLLYHSFTYPLTDRSRHLVLTRMPGESYRRRFKLFAVLVRHVSNASYLALFIYRSLSTRKGVKLALKIRNTGTTTKTRVAYGNSHMACG